MKLILKALITAVALLPALVFAHGAPRITVTESIEINAEPATVWAAVKNFDSAHTWIPAIASTEASGGNEKGATRTLTLQNGATIKEELNKFSEDKMSYNFEITDISSVGEVDDHGEKHEVPAFPVSKFKAWITVSAVDGGSKVTWKAKFFRAYHGSHHPPKELDDDAAKNAVTGFISSTLASLKKQLEK